MNVLQYRPRRYGVIPPTLHTPARPTATRSVQTRHTLGRPRLTRFEGGHIGVRGSLPLATDWYCQHLGLHVVWRDPEQTLLAFPSRIPLPLSAIGHSSANAWSDGDGSRSANIRLCLESPRLEETHARLAHEGVRVTPLVRGPGGVDSFDFYDLEGTRLTAVSSPAFPPGLWHARFTGFTPPRIGVSELTRSLHWYETRLGMTTLAQGSAEGLALMGLQGHPAAWLETLPESAFRGLQDPLARPTFLTPDVVHAYRACREAGLAPSVISGTPGTPQSFGVYDPDGNRITLWSYPQTHPQAHPQTPGAYA